jgi:hypothetical protein
MSDPRFSDDPRFTSPEQRMREERLDPTLDPIERERSGGAVWGWVAGIAVLVLIAFVLIGGWGGGGSNNTASNNRTPATTTGSAPSAPAPATTGSAPSAPATTGTAPAR